LNFQSIFLKCASTVGMFEIKNCPFFATVRIMIGALKTLSSCFIWKPYAQLQKET